MFSARRRNLCVPDTRVTVIDESHNVFFPAHESPHMIAGIWLEEYMYTLWRLDRTLLNSYEANRRGRQIKNHLSIDSLGFIARLGLFRLHATASNEPAGVRLHHWFANFTRTKQAPQREHAKIWIRYQLFPTNCLRDGSRWGGLRKMGSFFYQNADRYSSSSWQQLAMIP